MADVKELAQGWLWTHKVDSKGFAVKDSSYRLCIVFMLELR